MSNPLVSLHDFSFPSPFAMQVVGLDAAGEQVSVLIEGNETGLYLTPIEGKPSAKSTVSKRAVSKSAVAKSAVAKSAVTKPKTCIGTPPAPKPIIKKEKEAGNYVDLTNDDFKSDDSLTDTSGSVEEVGNPKDDDVQSDTDSDSDDYEAAHGFSQESYGLRSMTRSRGRR